MPKMTVADKAITAYMLGLIKSVEAEQILLKYTARRGLSPRWELTIVDKDFLTKAKKGHTPQEVYDKIVKATNA